MHSCDYTSSFLRKGRGCGRAQGARREDSRACQGQRRARSQARRHDQGEIPGDQNPAPQPRAFDESREEAGRLGRADYAVADEGDDKRAHEVLFDFGNQLTNPQMQNTNTSSTTIIYVRQNTHRINHLLTS